MHTKGFILSYEKPLSDSRTAVVELETEHLPRVKIVFKLRNADGNYLQVSQREEAPEELNTLVQSVYNNLKDKGFQPDTDDTSFSIGETSDKISLLRYRSPVGLDNASDAILNAGLTPSTPTRTRGNAVQKLKAISTEEAAAPIRNR